MFSASVWDLSTGRAGGGGVTYSDSCGLKHMVGLFSRIQTLEIQFPLVAEQTVVMATILNLLTGS